MGKIYKFDDILKQFTKIVTFYLGNGYSYFPTSASYSKNDVPAFAVLKRDGENPTLITIERVTEAITGRGWAGRCVKYSIVHYFGKYDDRVSGSDGEACITVADFYEISGDAYGKNGVFSDKATAKTACAIRYTRNFMRYVRKPNWERKADKMTKKQLLRLANTVRAKKGFSHTCSTDIISVWRCKDKYYVDTKKDVCQLF